MQSNKIKALINKDKRKDMITMPERVPVFFVDVSKSIAIFNLQWRNKPR